MELPVRQIPLQATLQIYLFKPFQTHLQDAIPSHHLNQLKLLCMSHSMLKIRTHQSYPTMTRVAQKNTEMRYVTSKFYSDQFYLSLFSIFIALCFELIASQELRAGESSKGLTILETFLPDSIMTQSSVLMSVNSSQIGTFSPFIKSISFPHISKFLLNVGHFLEMGHFLQYWYESQLVILQESKVNTLKIRKRGRG